MDSGRIDMPALVPEPDWPCPQLFPSLQPRTVDIWWVASGLDRSYQPSLFECLSSAERDRAARFRFEKDRWSYQVSHAWKRRILGRYLDRDPAALAFATGEWGKPELASPEDHGIRFNLSHSKGVTLIAVAPKLDLGVDVEELQNAERMEPIFQRFGATEEKAALAPDLNERDLGRMLTAWWVGKEAYIKAVGMGLSLPLDQFSLSLGTAPPWTVLRVPEKFAESQHWRLNLMRVGNQHYAACLGAYETLRTYRVEERQFPLG